MDRNCSSTTDGCNSFDENICASFWTINERFSDKMTPREKLYTIPTVWMVALFIAYGSSFLIALIGNGLVLWLVWASKSMRTVKNTFICNLAAADIIISLFTVPFHFQAALFQRWDAPHLLCPVCPFTQELSVLVSVFTVSAIALQRYGAVVHPLRIITTKWTPCVVVLLIWLAAFGIAIPTFIDFGVKIYPSADFTQITPLCQSRYLSESFKWYYYQCLVFAQYVAPLFIISLAYYKTKIHLWCVETPGLTNENRDAMILNKKKKVAKMMVIVVVLFALSWFPYQTYNFLQIHFPGINNFYYINFIWLWIHWLAMSNSCVNPFIYAILSEKFQEELKSRWRHRRGNNSEEPTNIPMLLPNVRIPSPPNI